MPADFGEDIRRLILESIASVALNTRLGLLSENRESEEAKQLINALENIVDLSFQLNLMPPIWKYLPMPKFKKLIGSLDTIADICYSHIQEALQRIEEDAKAGRFSTEPGQETSILEKLARFDRKTAVIIAMDLFFAGVDPVSNRYKTLWCNS